MPRLILAATALLLTSLHLPALAAEGTGEAQFRSLYKELVETNTTLSTGSCTLAAERVAARLKAAGLAPSDLHLLVEPAHPKEGNLIAVYPGRNPQLKALLLLAHLDVVEAKREDWTRDPFVLVEENGNFYARGAKDDKALAAIYLDTLVRLASAHERPERTVKLALTCGEETSGAFNGAEWLMQSHRDLIDAAFALNEGAHSELDAQGRHVAVEIEVGQKVYQDYWLEVTNPGGHSSRPRRDNAIYQLAGALKRLEAFEFPAQFSDGSRAYFEGMAKIEAAQGNAQIAAAMSALLKDPPDARALALVSSSDPGWNTTLRTTCVATMMDAGHAVNALPQRARANVNCRIFPGGSIEAVRATLQRVVADPQVTVTARAQHGPALLPPPPPLGPAILGPIQQLAAEFWPGVPVLPILLTTATDAVFTNSGGIPTYGLDPVFVGPDLGNIHGRNEYVRVQSVLEGREFLFRLIKQYAAQ